MSLMASLVTTSRMQQCFNVLIDIYHEFLLLFYCCVLLEIKLTTTTTNEWEKNITTETVHVKDRWNSTTTRLSYRRKITRIYHVMTHNQIVCIVMDDVMDFDLLWIIQMMTVQCMKHPVAHSLSSTWFWVELLGNGCELLEITMKCQSNQFVSELVMAGGLMHWLWVLLFRCIMSCKIHTSRLNGKRVF